MRRSVSIVACGKGGHVLARLTEAAYLMRARLNLPDPSPLLDLVFHHELQLSAIE